jgi:hypothetical protein
MKTLLPLSPIIASSALALMAALSVTAQSSQPSEEPRLGTTATNAAGSSPGRSSDLFEFPGGTPRMLLEAVQKKFKVDWSSVAEIPEGMESIQIPKFRIDIVSEISRDYQPLKEIVRLYNKLGDEKTELGKLIVEPEYNPANPSIVMFVPQKSPVRQPAEIKVKAFPLRRILKEDWKKIREDILRASEEAMSFDGHIGVKYGTRSTIVGDVGIHEDTSVLVAYGTPSFVDMVESIVAAHQANAPLMGR